MTGSQTATKAPSSSSADARYALVEVDTPERCLAYSFDTFDQAAAKMVALNRAGDPKRYDVDYWDGNEWHEGVSRGDHEAPTLPADPTDRDQVLTYVRGLRNEMYRRKLGGVRYRVWDGEKMHNPTQDEPCTIGYQTEWALWINGMLDRPHNEYRGGAISLLSTGLRDIDGDEVFEGDIIETASGVRAAVLRDLDTGGFMLTNSLGIPTRAFVAECKVVGHVLGQADA